MIPTTLRYSSLLIVSEGNAVEIMPFDQSDAVEVAGLLLRLLSGCHTRTTSVSPPHCHSYVYSRIRDTLIAMH